MPEAIQLISIPELLQFRDDLELGDGLFQEITGVSVSALFAYRRGRLKEKPKISPDAFRRIERAREVLQLGLELNADHEKALDWVYTESPNLDGRSPIDLTVSDAALETVRIYIAKLRAAVGAIAKSSYAQASKTAEGPKPSPPDTRRPQPSQISPSDVGAPSSQNPPSAISQQLVRKNADSKKKTQTNDESSNGEPNIVSKKIPKSSATTKPPRTAPQPPPGISLGVRVFRIKEPLAKLRALKPAVSLKTISQAMVKRGFKQFSSPSYMSRLANSYTWATWEEVVAIAGILDVSPTDLGNVYSPPQPHS